MATIGLAERHDLQELPIRGLGVSLDQTKVPLQRLRIDKRLSTPVSISGLPCDDSPIDAKRVHTHFSIGPGPTAGSKTLD